MNRKSTMSTVNSDAARAKFDLTLKDVCWDIPIVAAQPSSTTWTFDLWSKWTVTTDNGQTIQSALGWPNPTTYCGGGFTHSVNYIANVVGTVPTTSTP